MGGSSNFMEEKRVVWLFMDENVSFMDGNVSFMDENVSFIDEKC